MDLPPEILCMIYTFSDEQTQRSFKQTCRSFSSIKVEEEEKYTKIINRGLSFNAGTCYVLFNEIHYDFPPIRGRINTDKNKSNRHDYILEFCKYTAVLSAVCKKCGKIELPIVRKCIIN